MMSQSPSMFPLVLVGVIGIVVLILAIAMRRSRAELRTPTPPSSPPAPLPEEKPKPYTYKDFAKDLADENVEISDILERCKGALPPEPLPVPPVPPQEEPKGPDGGTAPKGQDGGGPPQGPDGGPNPTPRMRTMVDKQAWFSELAKELPKLKLVPPPVPKALVVAKGFTVPCTCVSERRLPGGGSLGLGHHDLGPNQARKPFCSKCNDTGVIVVTGGK